MLICFCTKREGPSRASRRRHSTRFPPRSFLLAAPAPGAVPSHPRPANRSDLWRGGVALLFPDRTGQGVPRSARLTRPFAASKSATSTRAGSERGAYPSRRRGEQAARSPRRCHARAPSPPCPPWRPPSRRCGRAPCLPPSSKAATPPAALMLPYLSPSERGACRAQPRTATAPTTKASPGPCHPVRPTTTGSPQAEHRPRTPLAGADDRQVRARAHSSRVRRRRQHGASTDKRANVEVVHQGSNHEVRLTGQCPSLR